ncbi:ChaN family lipoprotein [Myxococcaceae bacterium JPH2]|nr:ChaN family lipoprotein [Myxococcaceae bacterium JPH2]
MSRTLLAGLFLMSLSCAGRTPSPSGAAPPSAPRAWQAPLHRDHPLVGRIWDVAQGRFVDEATLLESLRPARFVLVGERHDQPDHHQLQAELVRALAKDARPALAFEMLDTAQAPAVEASLSKAPGDADALARAVDWEHSGWPAWALYRPVFVAGLEAKLPIVAANLPRTQVRQLVKEGPTALEPELRARLGLDTPVPEDEARAVSEELDRSHCGQLPAAMMDPMALAQRARDAVMADRLLASATPAGAVLIAGNGHARTDRGVPAHLARRAPGVKARSVGLIEVSPDAREPQDYAATFSAARIPYDYVWFTPAVPEEDPCAPLRKARPQ